MILNRCVRPLLTAALSLLLAPAAHAQIAVNWGTQGHSFRASGGADVMLMCPPRGTLGSVWGTDTYTDDSSVCSAAVHAGFITVAEGGMFTLRIKPGMPRYNGSVRNGVTSRSYEEWEGSFTIHAARAPTPEPIVRKLRPDEPPPETRPAEPEQPIIPWDRTAGRLAPNGRRFTFECLPRGTPAVVKGVDLYSWDSSICTAAVHAGAITLERGGVVTVEMRPGAAAYTGSARHGVTSIDGARTTLAFVIITPATNR